MSIYLTHAPSTVESKKKGKTMLSYVIANAEEQSLEDALEMLEEQVAVAIEEGATPQGGVSVAVRLDAKTGQPWYVAVQAVVMG